MASRQKRRTDNGKMAGDFVLRALIDHGRRRGQVTRGEVLEVVPDAEFDDSLYGDVAQEVTNHGIELRDEMEQPVEDFPGEGETLTELPDFEVAAEAPVADLQSGIESDNMIRMYLREAAQVPLLNADEERQLAQQIERCRAAQEKLKGGKVEPERRRELQQEVQLGREARERLIRANTRLVISVARRYMGYGMPLLDLIQEGNIGLMRAVRHFDYRRGFRFSTYATWWIRQAITRAMAEQSRPVRLPLHMNDAVNRILREQARLQQKLGRAPTAAELGQVLSLTPDKVGQMLEIIRQPLSLQAPISDEAEDELGDILGDPSMPNPEEVVSQILSDEDLRKRLDRLPPREQQVIRMRFGLDGEAPLTLRQAGERMGITRERARQLESQALERLRHPEVKRRRGRLPKNPRRGDYPARDQEP